MGWQERERDIREALKTLKNQQTKYGTPGLRLHDEGMVDRVARIKALEIGACRRCQSLDIENKAERGLVSLRCQQGKSPLDLHRPYVFRLGEVPECEVRIPFEE